MAPYPEEVDVFSAPHSRMKALVDVYSEKLTCTDFTDYNALESLLHDLDHTFCEFKSHEQIENKYIMRKLKKRLKMLQIQDAAVCNCHSDNKLSDMLALVRDGYSCTTKPEAERIDFGIRLRNALREFTGSFLPHMKEEEEVFQPMLMKYFEYEELKNLKEQVIHEHNKWHVYEKNTLEDAQADQKVDGDQGISGVFHDLPADVLSQVFSFLSPKELLQCSQVCRHWYQVSRWPSLWKEIYPCYWAHGIWEGFENDDHEDRLRRFYPHSRILSSYHPDEDADIDEYDEREACSSSSSSDEESHSEDLSRGDCQRESRTLQAIIKYILPQVGAGVQKIVLSSSRSLTSSMLRSILILCPNVQYLDASYTAILDSAFKGIREHSALIHLSYLNLSGCHHLSDLSLVRLADCFIDDSPSAEGLQEIEEFCHTQCCWTRNTLMCRLAKVHGDCPFVTIDNQVVLKEERKEKGCERTGSIQYLNVSGCKDITDEGLICLLESGVLTNLQFLDVSGCYLLSGPTLCYLTDSLRYLRPENLSYCDRIMDGPWPDAANGCQNLESELRSCCCQLTL